MAKRGLAPRHRPSATEQRIDVAQTVFGKTFSNPIGLAAGFDKDGEIIAEMLDLGFGFVEIGTVTPLPQPGNPQPRMFRLPQDAAIINRYGFNSQGAAVVAQNLQAYRSGQRQQQQQETRPWWKPFFRSTTTTTTTGLVGVNIGKNKTTTTDVASDYVTNIQQLGPYADYLVINISSPNTAGLRDLQQGTALRPLLQACLEARNQLAQQQSSQSSSLPPLLVKLAPDLSDDELRQVAEICVELHIDGLVVSNTTNQIKANDLISFQHQHEPGGLSGAPLRDASTACIRKLYQYSAGQVPIIGVGGVGSGRDAYEKLRAGASLVQIYSMMVYEGPGLVSRIRHELAEIMLQNGQRRMADVVGLEHEEIAWRTRREQLRIRDDAVRSELVQEEEEEVGDDDDDDDDGRVVIAVEET